MGKKYVTPGEQDMQNHYRNAVGNYISALQQFRELCIGCEVTNETFECMKMRLDHSHKILCRWRDKLKLTGGYDINKPYSLQSCRMDVGGELVGTNVENAHKVADAWVKEFAFKGNCTLFELGSYILTLK